MQEKKIVIFFLFKTNLRPFANKILKNLLYFKMASKAKINKLLILIKKSARLGFLLNIFLIYITKI